MDSCVLLDLTVRALAQTPAVRLEVVHVNHHIHPEASAWASFCEQLALSHGLKFHSLEVTHPLPKRASLESALRDARHTLFQSISTPDSVVLLAHHADDQAETLLMRLCKGSGFHGLGAMHPVSQIHSLCLVRPLLNFPREALEAYANARGLSWVTDESNEDLHFDRNYLRQTIFPLLKARYPSVVEKMNDAALHCRNQSETAHKQARIHLEAIQTTNGLGLSVPKLNVLAAHEQIEVLRMFLAQFDPTPRSKLFWRHLKNQLIEASVDRNPLISFGQGNLTRFKDELRYVVNDMHGAVAPLTAGIEDLIDALASSGYHLKRIRGQGLSLEKIKQLQLTVRVRQGGERLHLPGRQHTSALKKLLQAAEIPPWLRPVLPLLFVDDELIYVPHLGPAKNWEASTDEWGLVCHQAW